MKKKKVSKNEFDKYIAEYSKELTIDVDMMPIPEVISYNDFTLGKWPDSIVAYKQPILGKGGDIYAGTGEYNYYTIEA